MWPVMNESQTAGFRQRLIEERERIVAEWNHHGGGSGPGEGWDLRDTEERADLATTETVERRLTEDYRNLLRKVELALKRLDEGSYTRCEQCGGEIPLERLTAKPSVSLCLSCQQVKDAAKA